MSGADPGEQPIFGSHSKKIRHPLVVFVTST